MNAMQCNELLFLFWLFIWSLLEKKVHSVFFFKFNPPQATSGFKSQVCCSQKGKELVTSFSIYIYLQHMLYVFLLQRKMDHSNGVNSRDLSD